MIHLIGLGGGGCNVLEYAMKQGFDAAYTFVTSTKRAHQPWDIEFIEWQSPKNYFEDPDWYKAQVIMPERLRIRIMKYQQNIIVSSLGGCTGNLLTKAILNYNWPDILQFRYILSTPFRFEGRLRQEASLYFIKAYENADNFDIVSCETLRENMGDLTLLQAFLNVDKYTFDLIKSKVK